MEKNHEQIMVDDELHYYDVLSTNITSKMFQCSDRMRANGRVIMSHIIKDDGLIAQRPLYALTI